MKNILENWPDISIDKVVLYHTDLAGEVLSRTQIIIPQQNVSPARFDVVYFKLKR